VNRWPAASPSSTTTTDGKMDIFFTNGAKLPELKKNRPRVLQLPASQQRRRHVRGRDQGKAGLLGETIGYNLAVAVGDYDNDGFEDIFICGRERNTPCITNNGDGTFTDVTEQSGIGGKPPGVLSVGAAWFDYDNDGLLDLVVSKLHNLDAGKPTGDAASTASSTTAVRRFTRVHRIGYITTWATAGFEDVTGKSGFAAARAREWESPSPTLTTMAIRTSSSPTTPSRTPFSSNKGNGTFEDHGPCRLGVASTTMPKRSPPWQRRKDYGQRRPRGHLHQQPDGADLALYRNRWRPSFATSRAGPVATASATALRLEAAFINYDTRVEGLVLRNGDSTREAERAPARHQFRNLGQAVRGRVRQIGRRLSAHRLSARIGDGDLKNDGFEDLVVTSLHGAGPASS